jgi:hypothetical protein
VIRGALDGEGLDGGSDAGGDNYLGGVREIVGMHARTAVEIILARLSLPDVAVYFDELQASGIYKG